MILKGQDALDKANKMMESLGVSQKKDSYSNVEKTELAYDGKIYGIIKEGTKYLIKVATNNNPQSAEDFDYIDGVRNKHKYSKNTINEAEKTLNLWNIEFSRVYGNSLLNEAKYVMKIANPEKKKLNEPVISNEPPSEETSGSDDSLDSLEADLDSLEGDSPEEGGGSEEDMGDSEELTDNPDNPDDYADVDPDSLDTEDPKKMIQKLSGKLAYELREYGEDDYSDTAKFAMAMVTSALKAEKMSDEDKDDLENKLDKKLSSSEDSELDLDVDNEVEPEADGADEMQDDQNESLDFRSRQQALSNNYRRGKTNESIIIKKSDLVKVLTEDYSPSIESWAHKIAHDFNVGKISNTAHLLSVIENMVESYDKYVDLEVLRNSFESMIHGSRISGQMILNLVDVAMESPLDEDLYFEEDEDSDNLLFDDDDVDMVNPNLTNDDDLLFDIDEEVYSEKNKTPKNTKYLTGIAGVGKVGRLVGDDDAVDEKIYFDL